MKQSTTLRFLILSAASALLIACTPTIASRGHKLNASDMAALKPGMTQDQIITAIGTPTAQSAFDAHEWYYVSERTEQTAFFNPVIKERSVVVLNFDDNDTLKDIKTLSEKDGQKIAMDKDTTPTSGQDYTIMQQMLGNIGRFNSNTGN